MSSCGRGGADVGVRVVQIAARSASGVGDPRDSAVGEHSGVEWGRNGVGIGDSNFSVRGKVKIVRGRVVE